MHYFGRAKALTAHCCSKGRRHHPNPGCSVLMLGCIWAFLNRLFCAPSYKLCWGGIWGPCLSVGFLSGVPDSLYNHIGTHLHGPSACQSGCVAFGATRFPDGKVSARNRTAFPRGSLLTGPAHRYREHQSPCVGRIPVEIQAFPPPPPCVVSFILLSPSVLGLWDTCMRGSKAETCQTHCTCEQPRSDLSCWRRSVGPGQPLPTQPSRPCRH